MRPARGFATTLVLLILALVVIAGGGAYYFSTHAHTPTAQTAATTTPTGSGSSAPSATIDANSLTTASPTPTITGGADAPYVALIIINPADQSAPDVYESPITPVAQGTWAVAVAKPIPPDTYLVELYGYGDATGTSGHAYGVLAAGTLVVQ